MIAKCWTHACMNTWKVYWIVSFVSIIVDVPNDWNSAGNTYGNTISHGIQHCGNMSRKDLLNFLWLFTVSKMFQRIICISQHYGTIFKHGIERGCDFAVYGRSSTPYIEHFEGAEHSFYVVENQWMWSGNLKFSEHFDFIHGMTSHGLCIISRWRYRCPHFVAECQNNCLGEPLLTMRSTLKIVLHHVITKVTPILYSFLCR